MGQRRWHRDAHKTRRCSAALKEHPFRVQGLGIGFRVLGSGSRVYKGIGFRVQGLGFRANKGFGFMVQGLWFRVYKGFGFRVQGLDATSANGQIEVSHGIPFAVPILIWAL